LIEVFKNLRNHIHGVVHCSGGAQTKILHFVENLHVIKDNLFDVPPLFNLIREQSKAEWKEMYKVFNMGHRMELYVEEQFASQIISISKSFDIEAKIIGHVESFNRKKVTLKSFAGEFVYE